MFYIILDIILILVICAIVGIGSVLILLSIGG